MIWKLLPLEKCDVISYYIKKRNTCDIKCLCPNNNYEEDQELGANLRVMLKCQTYSLT